MRGVRITIHIFIIGAENIEKLSADSFASDFGLISPNTSTTTVITMVAIVVPLLPYNSMNSAVAIAVIRILTILLPIRILESRLS